MKMFKILIPSDMKEIALNDAKIGQHKNKNYIEMNLNE